MKILCVADHVDPLVYSPNIKERFKNVSGILGAGDLEIPYYEYIISCLNKPLWFVFGNHNLRRFSHFHTAASTLPFPGAERPHYGSLCIEGRVVRDRKRNLIIAGLGGCRRYNSGQNQFTETQMLLRCLGLIPGMLWHRLIHGRWLDILLTHAPPKGIHDGDDLCHTGFAAFLWFMRIFKPQYLVHGHVHLYEIGALRESTYHDTTVINTYDHTIIELEPR